jgi:hypothetical protein
MAQPFQVAKIVIAGIVIDMIHIKACPGTSLPFALGT